MKIAIKKYEFEDLEEMLAIWNEVVAEGFAFPQEKAETLASAKEFFQKQSYCGVARNEENGKIVGLYILHPNNLGRCGHICNCSYAVKKSARGHGAGRALVADSLEMGKKLGFTIMQFNAVTVDNQAANKLYQQLGFKKIGALPGGFRRPDGCYVDINLYYHPL